jgi:N-acetylmuramoyl-L-alanine amidase
MDMFHRFFRIWLLALLFPVISVPLTSAYADNTIDVFSARLGIHKDKTRFVMELSKKPVFDIFLLPDPYRIVIDMPQLNWVVKTDTTRKKGVVENYRFGLFKQNTSRVVLEVDGPVRIIKTAILPPSSGKPYRFYIDIQKTDVAGFMADVEKRRKKKSTQEVVTLTPPTLPKPIQQKYTIVIDAGHGGIDPGAIGKSGVYEKKLTLEVSRKLFEILNNSPIYKPIMTRSSDNFLSLRERVDIGREVGADLFISVHADSISRSDFRGATVYTLSETASDDEAAEIARRENKSDLIAGVDLEEQDDTVQGILVDLAQRETMNFSVKFAKLLIPEISKSGLKTSGRSHRFAGFRVLKAPDVPSVLVELGYLSNKQDEKILKSSKGQTMLAQSIANAIDIYFKTENP